MPLVELSTGPSFQQGGRTERQCSRRENSNLVQITSRDTSLWRGKLWSAITFKIKIDNYFVRSAAEGGSYTLRPVIVDDRTREEYSSGGGSMVKLKFGKNTSTLDAAVATVTEDLDNTIEAEFHQDLFEHGDSFSLVVEASRENDTEVIFGVSQTIVVTNFSLDIEQTFLQNPHVSHVGDNDFAWYNKCGGDKSGLSVVVRLKDERGRIVNPFDVPTKLKTEIVYDDGSPTPLMPLAPLKARRSSVTSSNPLYRPLVSDPILEPGQGSLPFFFRIEEVSFHHPGHAGFKLKVSPVDPAQHLVHPGLLEETIIVLSKPKHEPAKTKKRGGRISPAMPNLVAPKPTKPKHNATKAKKRSGRSSSAMPTESRKVRKVSNVSIGATDDPNAHVTVPKKGLVDVYRFGGCCRFCNEKIDSTAFLKPESHQSSCLFSAKLLLPTKMHASQNNTKPQARTQPPVDLTVPNRSFYQQVPLLSNPTATRGPGVERMQGPGPVQFMGQSVVRLRHPGALVAPPSLSNPTATQGPGSERMRGPGPVEFMGQSVVRLHRPGGLVALSSLSNPSAAQGPGAERMQGPGPVQYMDQSVVRLHHPGALVASSSLSNPSATRGPGAERRQGPAGVVQYIDQPPQAPAYRALSAANRSSKPSPKYDAAPMVAPVKSGSDAHVPGLSSSSSNLDSRHHAVDDGSSDDGGGVSELGFCWPTFESRDDEEYHSAPEGVGGCYHIESV